MDTGELDNLGEEQGPPVSWRFTAQPVKLTGEEFMERYGHWNMPEKFEAYEGKLFWAEEQRLHVLGMLIEALGTDAVEEFIARHRA